MRTLTHRQLAELVSNISGATFVSFEAEVDARARKTGNPYGVILKRSEVNGCIGFDYEKSVNRQQQREGSEGDFEAEPRKWGTRINRSLVEHVTKDGKRKLYLTLKVERVLTEPRFIQASNGQPLSADAVKPFLPVKQSNAEHQGVEKEIIYRDYSFDSIRNLRVGGEHIALVPDDHS